jgi:hypothetical protein
VVGCFPWATLEQLFLESAFFSEGGSGLAKYLPQYFCNPLKMLTFVLTNLLPLSLQLIALSCLKAMSEWWEK